MIGVITDAKKIKEVERLAQVKRDKEDKEKAEFLKLLEGAHIEAEQVKPVEEEKQSCRSRNSMFQQID